jgi:hypothetical protein
MIKSRSSRCIPPILEAADVIHDHSVRLKGDHLRVVGGVVAGEQKHVDIG